MSQPPAMVIERSGIHTIGEPQRALWLDLKGRLADILPFADANKISDEDLAYRFLIARQWNADLAEKLLRDYLTWRHDENIDGIRDETFPADLPNHYAAGFHGFDRDGRPVYYERPDPRGVTTLLGSFEKATLVRWHYCVLERARERYRLAGRDRITIILDAGAIGMSILTNTTAVTFLKELIVSDQVRYPEHMMYLFVINAPMVFSTLWNLVKPMIDERSQRKVHIWRGNYLKELQNYIDLDQIPTDFGGQGGPFQRLTPDPAIYRAQLAALRLPGGQALHLPDTVGPASPVHSEGTPLLTLAKGTSFLPRASSATHTAPADPGPHPAAPVNPLKPRAGATAAPAHHDTDPTNLTSTTRAQTVQSRAAGAKQRSSSRVSFCTAVEGDDDLDTARNLSDDSVPDGFDDDDVNVDVKSDEQLLDAVEALASPLAPRPSHDPSLNPPLRMEAGTDAKGFQTVQGWHLGRCIAETRNNLVVDPTGGALVAELCLEEGHVWRVVVQLHDTHRVVRFAFMRRRLHREVLVFLCGQRDRDVAKSTTAPNSSRSTSSRSSRGSQGNASLAGKRSLQNKSKPTGERIYILSCLPVKDGLPGDWVALYPGHTEWALHHRGDLLYWGGTLRDHEPELMFAFAVAVNHLWNWT